MEKSFNSILTPTIIDLSFLDLFLSQARQYFTYLLMFLSSENREGSRMRRHMDVIYRDSYDSNVNVNLFFILGSGSQGGPAWKMDQDLMAGAI